MVERVQVEAHVEANPTLEEQAAALDAAANANKAGETGDKPKILGKFADQQALEAGYSELERRSTQMAQELADLKKGKTPEVKPEEKPGEEKKDPPDPANANEAEAREAAQNAGVDFDALNAHYQEHGELTDEQYAQLEKGGIPRAMVDSYIAGQQALSANLESQAHAALGGPEQYAAMIEWAGNGKGLSAEEVAIYNREVNSGDQQRVMFAVNGLKSRFQQSEGAEPVRNLNGGAAPGGSDVFDNWQQVSAAMRTKEYRSDPAVRAKVAEKLGRSKLS